MNNFTYFLHFNRQLTGLSFPLSAAAVDFFPLLLFFIVFIDSASYHPQFNQFIPICKHFYGLISLLQAKILIELRVGI